ncbi:macro domain-containing protein [bacterium SCSIO 12827]|nr:macro domain-containing protein [bacterium SCSIO 12827]
MPSHDRLSVVEADITTLDLDAIVNAANEQLAPGGGVCGAIHRAAGPALARDCRALGGCPTGQARITRGHGLAARFVIHAVGPVWHGGGAGEDGLLAAAYQHSLALARDNDLASIAFPALSTGIFGFPADRAAAIAVAACCEFLDADALPERVVFCCFGAESAALHRQALADMHPG